MTDDRNEIDPCEARLRQAVLQLSERDAELATLRAERDDALQSCEIVAADRDAKVKDVMTLRAEVKALREQEPIWIVNEIGELGVMVNGLCYFMYKAGNIVYNGLPYDDGDGEVTRKIRTPFKREFGECVQPIDMDRLIKTGECLYKQMDLSEGEWVDMPAPPKWFKPSHKRGYEFMPEIRAALSPKDQHNDG